MTHLLKKRLEYKTSLKKEHELEEDTKGLERLPPGLLLQVAQHLDDEYLDELDQNFLNQIEASRLGLKGSKDLPPIDRKDSKTQEQIAWGEIFSDKENLLKALKKSQLTEDQVIDAATKYGHQDILDMMERLKEQEMHRILKNQDSLTECLKKACKTPEEIEAFANKHKYTKALKFMELQGRSIYKNAKHEMHLNKARELDKKDQILLDKLKELDEDIDSKLEQIKSEEIDELGEISASETYLYDKLEKRDQLIDKLTDQIIDYYKSPDPHGIDDIWSLVEKHSNQTIMTVLEKLNKREPKKKYEDIYDLVKRYYLNLIYQQVMMSRR